MRAERAENNLMHDINIITGTIIDSAMRIHSALGPGLFESVYEVALEKDLVRQRLKVERQKSMGFEFDGMRFEKAFVLDLIVEDLVVVEIKSVERLTFVFEKQLQTYLRLSDCPVGLLFNFTVPAFTAASRVPDEMSEARRPLRYRRELRVK